MTDQPRFLPASSFALDALAEIFTRSFEDYFYQGATTAEILARRVRLEQLDLHRSLVMLVGDEPAGQAMLALRGARAWCGGFGVLLPFRGRGLSRPLAVAMLDQARQAGARSFSLEVLTRNQRAIKTYARAGLRTRRDLLMLEWRQPTPEPRTENRELENEEQRTKSKEQKSNEHMDGKPSVAADVEEVEEPLRLLERFAALHPAPAAWQRDLPALLAGGGFRGLALEEDGAPAAYLLFRAGADGHARVEDLGAARVEQVSALLAALQARSPRILTINEPADSPLTAAFSSAGFVEIDRQHEMWVDCKA